MLGCFVVNECDLRLSNDQTCPTGDLDAGVTPSNLGHSTIRGLLLASGFL